MRAWAWFRGLSRLRKLSVVAGILVLGWLVIEWATWPDVASLATTPPRTTAFIGRWQEREHEAGRNGNVAWTWVPLSHISKSLALAALVAEDDTFFDHHGFAMAQVKDALSDAWTKHELPRGASTITQQVAKNLWLSPSRNPWRKLQEAALTVQLERDLDKRRILEIYLNVAQFGPGIYGAEAASRHYFDKGADALTDEEAAQLAASLPKPSQWHPGSASPAWKSRTRLILSRMNRSRWLVEGL